MIDKDFAMWYAIAGMATMILGLCRHLLNKGIDKFDELTVLSWFGLPFIYLPYLLIVLVRNVIVKNFRI